MAQDLISKYKKMFDDALSSKLSKATSYLDPSSNGGNNFWSSGVAQKLGNVQQAMENKTLPKLNLQQYTQGINGTVPRLAAQLGAGLVQDLANTPQRLLEAGARAGVDIRNARQGNAPGLARTIGTVAGVASPLLDIATLGGGSLVKGLGTKGLEIAGKQGLKQGIKMAAIKGGIEGGVLGGLRGLSEGDQATWENFLPAAGIGVGLGGLVGGVAGGIGGLKTLINRPKEVDSQLRDAAGRWVAGEVATKPKGMTQAQWNYQLDFNQRYNRNPYTPVMPSDLKKALLYEGEKRIGMQARDINVDKNPLGTPQSPGVEVEQIKQRIKLIMSDNRKSTESKMLEISPLRKQLNDLSKSMEPKVSSNIKQAPDIATPNTQATSVAPKNPLGDGMVTENPNMRRFSQRVSESPNVPPQIQETVKASPESYYKPISNKETMAKVAKLIADDETGALNLARTGNSTEANATSVALLEKYLKEGKFDQFNDLVNTVSPRFTSQGQAIQVLSVFDKLTPTGAVKYAKKIADEAGVPLPDGKIQTIVDKANKLNQTPGSTREKIINTADLIEEIKSVVPPTIGQKLSTLQTMAQLLNPVTAIRNTLGNTLFAGAENVSDVVGAGVDKLVSVITGKRTKVLPSIPAQASGAKRGLSEGVQDAIKGVNTQAGVSTQFELPATMTFKKGLLNKLEKVMNIELRATDRAAYQAAFDGSLNNQVRAAGVSAPTPDMLKIAHADALYRTFQDNSKLAQFFGGAKQMLNKFGIDEGKFGLGDLIIKYPKTPANILSRGIEYSPAGFIKGIYGAVRPLLSGAEFNQKQFVEDISRATVGTGLVTIGAILAKNGIITGRSEKDKDIAATDRAIGSGAFKFNVDALKRFFLSGFQKQSDQQGDTVLSYDWAQPTAIPFTMGANYILGGKVGDQVTSFLNSADAAIEGLTQQPLVKGLAQFATDFNQQGVGTALANAVAGAPASFVPTVLSKVASTIDRKARETYAPDVKTQAINQVVNKIPVLRSTLPQKYDTYGREVNYGSENPIKRIVQNFLSPSIITKIDIPEGAKEVIRIFENTGETSQAPNLAPKKVKINGQDVKLTGEQLSQYQKYIGQRSNQLLAKLSQNPSFNKLSDEDKSKLMANYLSDIGSAAKIEVLGNKPKDVSANVKSIINGNLSTKFTATTRNGVVKISRLRNPRKIRIKSVKPKKIKVKLPKVKKIKIKKLKKIKV